MQYGINITSFREWHIAQTFYKEELIDFVEILIDNFRNSDPNLLKINLENIPYAIHIMFSKFIESSRDKLINFHNALQPILSHLQPKYISDHIAKFTLDRVDYPITLELDYVQEGDAILDAATFWQNLLGTRLYLETFPSILETGLHQANFFNKLLKANKNLDVLFDISNLLIAELNGVNKLSDWKEIMSNAKHFHIAGYFYNGTDPQLVMDGHNRDLSNEALKILADNKELINKKDNTIVIERDYYYDIATWRMDILKVRKELGDG